MGYRPCNIDAEFLATCSAALSSSWKTLHENLGSVRQSTQTAQAKRPRCFQDQPLLISCCYWPFAQTTDDVILPWRTLPSAQESTLRMKNKAGMKWKKIKNNRHRVPSSLLISILQARELAYACHHQWSLATMPWGSPALFREPNKH